MACCSKYLKPSGNEPARQIARKRVKVLEPTVSNTVLPDMHDLPATLIVSGGSGALVGLSLMEVGALHLLRMGTVKWSCLDGSLGIVCSFLLNPSG